MQQGSSERGAVITSALLGISSVGCEGCDTREMQGNDVGIREIIYAIFCHVYFMVELGLNPRMSPLVTHAIQSDSQGYIVLFTHDRLLLGDQRGRKVGQS